MDQVESAAPGTAFIEANRDALVTLIDRIVPAIEVAGETYPTASEAGGLDFLARILNERDDWIVRVDALLGTPDDQLDGHPDFTWFAHLVSGGYWADEANGGNRGERSWDLLGWRIAPKGGWPTDVPVAEAPRHLIGPADLAERYDAIVIGSGAGAGVAACALAEAGRRVLVVEAGSWPDIAVLARDHIRNPRASWDVSLLSGPPDSGNPRVLQNTSGISVLRPSSWQWSSNAAGAGGGTRVYGAQAWRFGPKDFRMASTYGVPEGSAVADWPFGYEELEPYYERAEWEVGVAGDVTDGPHSGERARPYPMPPLDPTLDRGTLQAGASALGWSTLAVPLLINSRPWLGRQACVQCAQCIGFTCPIDAKNGSQNTMLTRAFATGLCDMIVDTTAERLVTDASGRVVAVALVGETSDGALWRATVPTSEVAVGGGAVESARLLLNSASDREPTGLGNAADMIGRHFQGHMYGGAIGLFDDEVQDLVGPGPSIATTDFRHGNDGVIGGGIIANEFVTTPSNSYRYLESAGFIPASGAASVAGVRELSRRFIRVMGPIQETTNADSRVQVDPSVRDRRGVPVARLSGSVHEEDYRVRDFLSDRADEWLRASGATTTSRIAKGSRFDGPSGGQHQAGSLRMGDDPATSAVDRWGRVWGHDNVRVVDSSVHVTNGGVNPVLTIFANAFRITDHMVGRVTG